MTDKIKTRKTPLQLRSKERVERIIETTEQLLIDCDPTQITTSLIARKANVPVGSIYQYFEDRNGVLLAVGDRVLHSQDQKLKNLFNEVSPHAHWRHVVKVVVEAYIKVETENVINQKLHAALAFTKEWKEINQSSANRVIEAFSQYGLLSEQGLSKKEALSIVRVIVIMTTAVVRESTDRHSKEDANLLHGELIKMITAYLGTILGD
ncbi:MAG: TetR/AcrR family transcriptional regulator [Sneathiella sp.]